MAIKKSAVNGKLISELTKSDTGIQPKQKSNASSIVMNK